MSNKNSVLAATSSILGPQAGISGNDPLYGVPAALVANNSQWGEVPATSPIPALFVNHFSTDIKAAAGWTVGYLRETGANSLPYDTTNIDTVTATQVQNAFEYLPSGQTILGWTNGGNEGYYRGNETTHEFEIYRIAAILNTNTLEIYLIKVTDLIAIPNQGVQYWQGQVNFEYRALTLGTLPTLAEDAKLPFLKKLMNV